MNRRLRKALATVGFSVAVLVAGILFLGPYAIRLLNEPWSIGILRGPSPLALIDAGLSNPVLGPEDVTDARARAVADPFMVKEGAYWYMFFEVMNADTGHGDIGLAESRDGMKWRYRRIVLDEPFHLSYPHVFKWAGQYYMTPESRQAGELRLYKASRFPQRWTLAKILIKGNFADPSPFRHAGRWWLFTEANPDRNDTLRIYFSEKLTGPYFEHPRSPVVYKDPERSRPAGRVLTWEGSILRFAQDCYPTYGNKVRAFQVTRLNLMDYEEREQTMSPVIQAAGQGWNATGMHHLDVHQVASDRWIACVDGRRGGLRGLLMTLGFFRLRDEG